MRHEIKLATQILHEQKSQQCFDRMMSEGDLLALSDDNATRLYTRYLQNYLDQGGTIDRTVAANFQNSDRMIIRVRAMESKASVFQESHLAENYRYARLNWPKSRTYLVRHAMKLCPLQGTQAIRLLVPRGVMVTPVKQDSQDLARDHTEVYYEEGRRWEPGQAVMYADTQMQRYPFHRAHLEYQRLKKSAWAVFQESFTGLKLAAK
jgi:hypothetical protein